MTAPSAGHTRPTHATVPGDASPDGAYFTLGKTYPIVKWEAEGFWVPNDIGTQSYCLAEGCAHLNGGNWILTAPAEDARKLASAADLIAALEALLPLALVKWGNLDPDANVALEAARAALRKARGEG